eukprot:TRINITY_DN34528_c0_g1_i1.p1 TRINITY_DN34528_c0_g1~~TRINITY_DN34528_c0_g1_i1.p1  ORF type:complete len:112 (-),score=31.13 TRINITY_DN34528_c0_g1_i1:113-448(-)
MTKQVKHIVMFNVKDGTTEEQIGTLRDALVDYAKKSSLIVAGSFKCDLKLEVSKNHPLGKNRDVYWEACFNNVEDYEAYAVDDGHTTIIKTLIAPIIEPGTRAAIQFERDA